VRQVSTTSLRVLWEGGPSFKFSISLSSSCLPSHEHGPRMRKPKSHRLHHQRLSLLHNLRLALETLALNDDTLLKHTHLTSSSLDTLPLVHIGPNAQLPLQPLHTSPCASTSATPLPHMGLLPFETPPSLPHPYKLSKLEYPRPQPPPPQSPRTHLYHRVFRPPASGFGRPDALCRCAIHSPLDVNSRACSAEQTQPASSTL
jgi:hypothetical protein